MHAVPIRVNVRYHGNDDVATSFVRRKSAANKDAMHGRLVTFASPRKHVFLAGLVQLVIPR